MNKISTTAHQVPPKRRVHSKMLLTVVFLVIMLTVGTMGSSSPPRASSGATSMVALTGRVLSQTCTPPSLAHCYTESTMQSYIDRVLPMVVQFFRAKYKAMPEPSAYYFIAEGQQMWSACVGSNGSRLKDATIYAYCSADHSIYLGQASMWHLYNADGDAAPAVALAHEWGHNIQYRVGVPEPMNNIEMVNHENQADCVAGAWIQYAGQQKWLEQEDVGSIARLIADIAGSESPNRDHGDLTERSNSMSLGLESGLEACNSFYPATPIIAS